MHEIKTVVAVTHPTNEESMTSIPKDVPLFSVSDKERMLIWIDHDLVLHKAAGVTPDDVIAVLEPYVAGFKKLADKGGKHGG